MDQLHTANKVCGGCCAISLNTVDTESSVSPKRMWFPNRFNTNRVVQAQKKCRILKFLVHVYVKEKLHIHVVKTKALTSFAITAKLIFAFVFTNAKCWFCHDMAKV